MAARNCAYDNGYFSYGHSGLGLHMSASSDKTMTQESVLDTVHAYLADLDEDARVAACVAEGRAVAEIAAPLGLPDDIVAAVQVYPLFRNDILNEESFKNSELETLSRFILGLKQIDEFDLPAHWRPGEAHGLQQCEALRKILLSVG